MEDLDRQLEDARRRAEEAIAAESFGETPAGSLALNYINERVSTLLTKMTSGEPMSDRDYLAAHGAVRELKSFHTMLNSKASQGTAAKAEIDAITGTEE